MGTTAGRTDDSGLVKRATNVTTLFLSFDPLARRLTKREITIENFRGLGKLLPKGTSVTVNTEAGTSDHGSLLVDAYLTPSAVFYGVRLAVDDLEPAATSPSNRNAAP